VPPADQLSEGKQQAPGPGAEPVFDVVAVESRCGSVDQPFQPTVARFSESKANHHLELLVNGAAGFPAIAAAYSRRP